MNGTDASTTFTDSSASAHSMTANGNAQIDTAQSVFGGASGLLDGSGDYVSSGLSLDWGFGTGDFAIDTRVRFAASPTGEQGIYGSDSTLGIDFFSLDTTTIRMFLAGSANNFTVPAMSANTWYHLAVTRSGSNVRVFLNGTESSSGAWSNGGNISFTTSIKVGTRADGSSGLNGWLDEFRLSKGAARWTANFTPPSAEYA